MKTITSSEAAELADVSDTTIIRWCKAGHVKHKICGLDRHYAIYKKSLLNYLETKTQRPSGFVTLQTASNYTGVCVSTLRKMTNRGHLKSKRKGKRLYVKKSDLQKLDGYDPAKARAENGRKSAALTAKSKASKSKVNLRSEATERQIAQDYILANIENMGKVKA